MGVEKVEADSSIDWKNTLALDTMLLSHTDQDLSSISLYILLPKTLMLLMCLNPLSLINHVSLIFCFRKKTVKQISKKKKKSKNL